MEGNNVVHATDSDFDSIVLKSDTPVLVDFYTTWCGPCNAIAPHVEAVAAANQGRLKVVKVNVEHAMETGTRFSVMSVPTLLLFMGGQVVDQLVGSAPQAKLEAFVDKHVTAQ